MKHSVRNYLIFATAGIVVLSGAALAASPPMNVRGTIAQVDGNTIDIKERDGGVAKIHLADNAKIVSVAKASLSDIKPDPISSREVLLALQQFREVTANCRLSKSIFSPSRCVGPAKETARGILLQRVA